MHSAVPCRQWGRRCAHTRAGTAAPSATVLHQSPQPPAPRHRLARSSGSTQRLPPASASNSSGPTSGSSYQPSSRRMAVLQQDEHSFFWGQPNSGPTAGGGGSSSHGSSSSAMDSGIQQGHVREAYVSPSMFHAIAAADSLGELQQLLELALEGHGEVDAADDFDSGGWAAEVEAGAGAGVVEGHEGEAAAAAEVTLVLPSEVVEVALAKVADWVLDEGRRGFLQPSELCGVVALLAGQLGASRMEPTAPGAYSVEDVGSILWSLASLLGAAEGLDGDASGISSSGGSSGGGDTSQGLAAVATGTLAVVRGWLAREDVRQELAGCGYLSQLVSLLWGYAALAAAVSSSSPSSSSAPGQTVSAPQAQVEVGEAMGKAVEVEAAVGASLDALARRAVELLSLSYGAGEAPVPAADLTDLSWGLAAAGRRSPDTGRLAEAVAHEVYRQISNRYSLQMPFSPSDLIKIVQSYARLKINDGSVPRMLDAVGGHVAKRIRARHVSAMTRPSDIAALLQGFADAGHRTVVIPELLAACGVQVCREVAMHNESLSPTPAPPRNASTSSSGGSGGASREGAAARFRRPHAPVWELQPPPPPPQVAGHHWSIFLSPAQVASILDSFLRLGPTPATPYHPSPLLLDSLLLAVRPQLPYMTAAEAAELTGRLAMLRHVPGPQTLEDLAAAALRAEGPTAPPGTGASSSTSTAAGTTSTTAVHRLRALWALMMMGWQPPPGAAEEVIDALLVLDDHDEDTEEDDEGGEDANGAGTRRPRLLLSVADAGRLMSALCLLPLASPSPAFTSASSASTSTAGFTSGSTQRPGGLTIQRFGRSCLRLRQAAAAASASPRGSSRSRSGSLRNSREGAGGGAGGGGGGGDDMEHAVLACGAAMTLLGHEGWEMADQVLPPALFRRAGGAVRRLLAAPYRGVEDSSVADVAAALGELVADSRGAEAAAVAAPGSAAAGQAAVWSAFRVPLDPPPLPPTLARPAAATAATAAVGWSHVGQDCEAAEGEEEEQEEEEQELASSYEPLECAALCAAVPVAHVGQALCPPSSDTPPPAGPHAEQDCPVEDQHRGCGQQQQFVTLVVDVCLPHDYAGNAPGLLPWGWTSMRQKLLTHCCAAAGLAAATVVAEAAGAKGGLDTARGGAGWKVGLISGQEAAGVRVLQLEERALYQMQGSAERVRAYVRKAVRRVSA